MKNRGISVKKLFIASLLMVFVFDANAAIKTTNHTAERFAAEMEEQMSEADAIATLENDIAILDAEIAKCEKSKKGWIAATVIGSAGVVSTGIAAGVQGVKIKDQKDTIASKNKEIKDLDAQIENKNKEIKEINAATTQYD
jgi:peptidoglycan hydrolase CwlO-like protein